MLSLKTKPELRVRRYAVIQSIAETTFGSTLHALQIPLSGHLLSLNQIFLHALTIKQFQLINSKNSKIKISQWNVFKSIVLLALETSAIKARSPAGKRVTPMLAIAIQGIFFAFPFLLLPISRFTLVIGAMFAGIWNFIQQLLIAWILFGDLFFKAILSAFDWVKQFVPLTDQHAIAAVCIGVMLKLVVSVIAALVGWHASRSTLKHYFKRVRKLQKRFSPAQISNKPINPVMAATFDVLRPWFLVGFSITTCFYFFSQPVLDFRSRMIPTLGYGAKIFVGAWFLYLLVRLADRYAAKDLGQRLLNNQ